MPGDLTGMVIVAAVSSTPATGYAVGQVLGAPGMALLETGDGGKTWQRTTTDHDATAHVRGLAWSPANPSNE